MSISTVTLHLGAVRSPSNTAHTLIFLIRPDLTLLILLISALIERSTTCQATDVFLTWRPDLSYPTVFYVKCAGGFVCTCEYERPFPFPLMWVCSVNFSRPHNVPSSANGACYRTTSGWPAWADQTANWIEGRKREDNDWQEERGKRWEKEELIQEIKLWTGRRRFILPGIHICSSLQVRLDQSDLKPKYASSFGLSRTCNLISWCQWHQC